MEDQGKRLILVNQGPHCIGRGLDGPFRQRHLRGSVPCRQDPEHVIRVTDDQLYSSCQIIHLVISDPIPLKPIQAPAGVQAQVESKRLGLTQASLCELYAMIIGLCRCEHRYRSQDQNTNCMSKMGNPHISLQVEFSEGYSDDSIFCRPGVNNDARCGP